jgi:hypothetical protein
MLQPWSPLQRTQPLRVRLQEQPGAAAKRPLRKFLEVRERQAQRRSIPWRLRAFRRRAADPERSDPAWPQASRAVLRPQCRWMALPPRLDVPLQLSLPAAWRLQFRQADAKQSPEWKGAPQQWEAPAAWAERSCGVLGAPVSPSPLLEQPGARLRAQVWRALPPTQRAPVHGLAERPALPYAWRREPP